MAGRRALELATSREAPGRALVDPASVQQHVQPAGDTTRMGRTLAADGGGTSPIPPTVPPRCCSTTRGTDNSSSVAVNIGTGREPFAGISKSAGSNYVVHTTVSRLCTRSTTVPTWRRQQPPHSHDCRGSTWGVPRINLPGHDRDRTMRSDSRRKDRGRYTWRQLVVCISDEEPEVAYRATPDGTTRIVYEIAGAHGRTWNSVGKMFESEECIRTADSDTGGYSRSIAPDPNDPDVREARW